ncbi:hypothetical protein M409DRAFT_17982 [Zasmidium cellare ATCC 36951]|uniref:N-acetyltransferase domain-containing protein n=1 Tax=Zasmidium cellare ATCC 36951 TaxID=1080233 RepID=A0A6A6CX05_ZASCE|nr:uncharacterized protein M409DRAFT_17982 [Zasmidium cellare ATCC 36951]KAF2171747.1 hypothetical protein M409DRAFT_17982 [Zasmidium cellare ATCC 36951]
MSSPFTIRPATLSTSDDALLIDFQESQIPWLSANGGAGQWGTESIRTARPESSAKTKAWVEKSQRQSPWSSGDWCRAFIAESTSDGTPVAGLVLEDRAAGYVKAVLPGQVEGDPFVYLTYLISNREAGQKAKGVGRALIAFAREEARKVGVRRLCLDCYRGNERKLVK